MGTVESGVCSASWYIMVLQKQKTYLIVLISLGMVHHVSAYGECSAGTGKSAGVCEWIGWAAKGREKNCGWNGRSSTCITCAGKTQSECSGLAPACEYVSNKCQGKHTVRINGDKCNGYYSSLFKLTDQDGIERTFDRCVWKRVQYNGEWKICQWRGGFCQHPDYGTTSPTPASTPTPAPTTTTKTCTCTNGQKVNTCTKNGEECKSCDAGHFLRASDKTCVKCDAGTFQGAATYEGASCSQCATAFSRPLQAQPPARSVLLEQKASPERVIRLKPAHAPAAPLEASKANPDNPPAHNVLPEQRATPERVTRLKPRRAPTARLAPSRANRVN